MRVRWVHGAWAGYYHARYAQHASSVHTPWGMVVEDQGVVGPVVGTGRHGRHDLLLQLRLVQLEVVRVLCVWVGVHVRTHACV
jgi:hypothetical protein